MNWSWCQIGVRRLSPALRFTRVFDRYSNPLLTLSSGTADEISFVNRLESLRKLTLEAVNAQIAFLGECDEIRYRDINAGGGVVFLDWNSWRWAPIPTTAQGPLGIARKATDALVDGATRATEFSEPGRLRQLKKALDPFVKVLAQDHSSSGAPGKSIAQISDIVRTSGDKVVEFLEQLPSAHGPGGRWLLPDTNALIRYPILSKWRNDKTMTLIIVPTVTQELDALKQKDGPVGEKADKVIRQLNEFDRRGDTFAGVKVAGELLLREVAMQPNFDRAPEWLVSDNNDDCVLASALELGWQDLRSEISIVTGDRNMKNRARLARIEIVDIDDAVGSSSSSEQVTESRARSAPPRTRKGLDRRS